MGLWPNGTLAQWDFSQMDLALRIMAQWHFGPIGLWTHGTSASWFFGPMILRTHGILANGDLTFSVPFDPLWSPLVHFGLFLSLMVSYGSLGPI